VSEVIGPDHDLEAAEVFPAGRSRPKTLHPRCRPKDGSGHSLAESVRRRTGQLEMHPKTSIKPHRLQLPVPRRESEGKSSAIHDADYRNLVTNPPASALDEEGEQEGAAANGNGTWTGNTSETMNAHGQGRGARSLRSRTAPHHGQHDCDAHHHLPDGPTTSSQRSWAAPVARSGVRSPYRQAGALQEHGISPGQAPAPPPAAAVTGSQVDQAARGRLHATGREQEQAIHALAPPASSMLTRSSRRPRAAPVSAAPHSSHCS
jgi:hypothetical protein